MSCICFPQTVDGQPYNQFIGSYFGDCVWTQKDYLSFVFGWSATLFFVVCMLPQMIQNYNRKTVDGLSYGLLVIWTFADVSNYIGTIFTNQLPTQRFMALYFIASDVVLVGQYIYYTRVFVGVGEREPLVRRHVEEEVLLNNDTGFAVLIKEEKKGGLIEKSFLATLFVGLFVLIIYLDGIVHWVLWGGSGREVYCDKSEAKSETLKMFGIVFAWISGFLYFSSRIPQILENIKRKSVQGLSKTLFVFTVFGNICYGMSIFLRLPEIDEKFYSSTLPYIIGSLGTISFDVVILFQAFVLYKKE